MDFIAGFPKTKKQNDSIMIVVDKMSKATHFILVKSTLKSINIVDKFMRKIFRLRRITKTVISIQMRNLTPIFGSRYL